MEYLNLRAFGAFGSAAFFVAEAALVAFFAGGATASLLVSVSARAFLFGGIAASRSLAVMEFVNIEKGIIIELEKEERRIDWNLAR